MGGRAGTAPHTVVFVGRILEPEVSVLHHLAITVGWSALLLFFYETAWFFAGTLMGRNDVADVAWGLGPPLLAWWLAVYTRSLLVVPMAALVSVWGVRLTVHIARRDFAPGSTEDPRYAEWRQDWRFFVLRSYLQVYLLQGFFLLLVSAPLIVYAAAPEFADPVLWALGSAIFAVGFVVETVADRQLAEFLAERKNRGHVFDRGLWSWSRHPNYFGETLVWWGLAVIALAVPMGWLGLIGPVTITLLLLFVSGIPLAERHRAADPEWLAYKARTSAFLPLPPRER